MIDIKKEIDLFINNKFGIPTDEQTDFINEFVKWFDDPNEVHEFD